MNDRSLHDDTGEKTMFEKTTSSFNGVIYQRHCSCGKMNDQIDLCKICNKEPEQPTPAAEVMIELMKRVSALEKDVELLKSYRVY